MKNSIDRLLKKGLLVPVLFLICQFAQAQTKDYKIQALYIFNFARNVEWPAQAQKDEIIVGVFNNAKVAEDFTTNLAPRVVNSKKFKVVNFASASQITDCNILFLPVGNKNQLKQALQQLGQASCLVVTEKEGLIKEGSVINFVITDEGKMKFEYSAQAALDRNLKVSTNVSSLAINN